MQIRLERVNSIGRKIGINDDKGIVIAIFVVLIIVSVVAAVYFIAFPAKPEGYSTIYLLDTQKTTDNYPAMLVANHNSTFSVWVAVENHRGATTQFQVLTKITPNLSTIPVNTPAINTTTITLENGKSWQSLRTITENQVGSYSVVFELWRLNPDTSTYEFTNNYCVLNIQVSS